MTPSEPAKIESPTSNEAKPTPATGEGFQFQVNLKAIIELLSQHIYSSPQVFIRELLQNGLDAIRMRQHLDPKYSGEVRIEVVPGQNGNPSTLIFEDDGIGLTLEEIHTFLSTIGSSFKRQEIEGKRLDFIGQFGIGILSCFIVTEEVVLITRSARPNQPVLEWRGRANGTYSIRVLEDNARAPGTIVFLRANPASEQYFVPSKVKSLASYYGSLLPFPIRFVGGEAIHHLNPEVPPWKQTYEDEAMRRAAYLDYGQEIFGMDFFDYIPLNSPEFGIEGVAFVLPDAANPVGKKQHRVYLKDMLLNTDVENIIPNWALFVRCVINSSQLRPMASREALYEDKLLQQTRDMLGATLRGYLVELSQHSPEALKLLIKIHHVAIKSLAAQDEEVCKVFIDYLPFQTSKGEMTLGEYKRHYPEIQYMPKLNEFRQLSQIVFAQGRCIINAGYTFEERLLEIHARLFPQYPSRIITQQELIVGLQELSPREAERTAPLIAQAQNALGTRCTVVARKFPTRDLPILYGDCMGDLAFQKAISGESSGAYRSMSISSRLIFDRPVLCLNYSNLLIQQLTHMPPDKGAGPIIQSLFLQSLLLGERHFGPGEITMLNQCMSDLVKAIMGRKADAHE